MSQTACRLLVLSLLALTCVAGIVEVAEAGVSSRGTSSYPPLLPRCGVIVCPSGRAYPTCTRAGYPINYFVQPCFGESSGRGR